mmetsp:Transcript_19338/g.35106  ORF Transcript_19338/g.35106 Transcript_19338/m.35106 type:complete len:86 (+) Transcript_19338:335-592(+)
MKTEHRKEMEAMLWHISAHQIDSKTWIMCFIMRNLFGFDLYHGDRQLALSFASSGYMRSLFPCTCVFCRDTWVSKITDQLRKIAT